MVTPPLCSRAVPYMEQWLFSVGSRPDLPSAWLPATPPALSNAMPSVGFTLAWDSLSLLACVSLEFNFKG